MNGDTSLTNNSPATNNNLGVENTDHTTRSSIMDEINQHQHQHQHKEATFESSEDSEFQATARSWRRKEMILRLVALVSMSFGLIGSYTAVIGCNFVEADSEEVLPFLNDLYYSSAWQFAPIDDEGPPHRFDSLTSFEVGEKDNNYLPTKEGITVVPQLSERDSTVGLGFFFFEHPEPQGKQKCSCSMKNKTNADDSSGLWIGQYVRYLGDDWQRARSFVCAGSFFAGLLWCWLLVSPCFVVVVSDEALHANHVRAQIMWCLLVVGCAVPLHAVVPRMVLDSGFCDEKHCQVGLGMEALVIGCFMYVLASTILLVHAVWSYYRHQQRPQQKKPFERRSTASQSRGRESEDEEDPNFALDGWGDAQEVPVDAQMIQAMMAAQRQQGQTQGRGVLDHDDSSSSTSSG